MRDIDLHGVYFGKFGAKDNAILRNTTLAWCNLEDAILGSVDMEGCNLYGANLKNAYLPEANLSNSTLARTNLSGANLYAANLQQTELSGATLANSYMVLTNFQGAQLEKESIGNSIIQENIKNYQQYFEKHDEDLPRRIVKWHLDKRY